MPPLHHSVPVDGCSLRPWGALQEAGSPVQGRASASAHAIHCMPPSLVPARPPAATSPHNDCELGGHGGHKRRVGGRGAAHKRDERIAFLEGCPGRVHAQRPRRHRSPRSIPYCLTHARRRPAELHCPRPVARTTPKAKAPERPRKQEDTKAPVGRILLLTPVLGSLHPWPAALCFLVLHANPSAPTPHTRQRAPQATFEGKHPETGQPKTEPHHPTPCASPPRLPSYLSLPAR